MRTILFWGLLAMRGWTETSPELFDRNTVQELRLQFPTGAWAALQAGYLEDTYFPADIEWRGIRATQIGVRSRGNGSRRAAKPGLKLDFGRYVPGQRFLGFRSLVLDNFGQDSSMMAESLSFSLFEALSIPTPRLAYIRLYVNERYAGLYAVVEPVDKEFLKRTMGNDSGYLFDYEWTVEYWFHFAGDEPETYVPAPFEPKTNEKAPEPEALVDLIRAVNDTPDEEFAATIRTYLDPNQFLRYLAVEAFTADEDGFLGDWGMNNFYLYRAKGQRRFVWLPWDKDFAFRTTGRSVWNNTRRNVLARRLLEVPEYRDLFKEKLSVLAEYSSKSMEAEVDRIAALIRPDVVNDENRGHSIEDFDSSVERLRRFSAERVQFVRLELASPLQPDRVTQKRPRSDVQNTRQRGAKANPLHPLHRPGLHGTR